MKKLMNVSFIYAILGLCAGVAYREITKFSGFEGTSALNWLHPHLLGMGMLFFLIAAILVKMLPGVEDEKLYPWFFWLYNVGLLGTVGIMAVRGLVTVYNKTLSYPKDMALTGMAGIFHMIFAAGLICFFLAFRKRLKTAD